MQSRATTWGSISNFLSSWKPNPFNVIVKPMESAGSDDVTLCHSISDVKSAFGNIMGKVNSLGTINDGVLVQEYLQGTEYVVDTCSYKGKHKVIAMWEYDRRPTNGAGFVLHGQRLMDATEPRATELTTYQFKVLDALGIKNGPGHGEVKWTDSGPCLVEVGSRCHGAEGMWMGIADEVFGYNQVEATVDAYTNTEGEGGNERGGAEGFYGLLYRLTFPPSVLHATCLTFQR
jgi:biotin carboxylase